MYEYEFTRLSGKCQCSLFGVFIDNSRLSVDYLRIPGFSPISPLAPSLLDMLKIENKRLRFCFCRHRNKFKNVALCLKINWNVFELDENAYVQSILLLFRRIDMVIFIAFIVLWFLVW